MDQLGPQEWRKLKILRQEQRDAVNKLNLLENDLSETKLVADALKQVDPDRKCYRSQGDILVEQTVKEVVPALEKSREQLEAMVTSVKKEITDKGRAIQAFMAENNIVVRK
jgi:prefoldin subunit 2